MNGAGAQAIKRIPRIKFPQRHLKPSLTGSQTEAPSTSGDSDAFFSQSNVSQTSGGKASLQPKRTPMSNEEMEAIMLGGSF